MSRFDAILPALLLVAGAGIANEWPAFRGPDGSGVSPETNLPVKWDKAEGLRWKVGLPGRGLSNPVIAGGRIYVSACSGYREKRLHVLCFEEATGNKLWERQFTATGNTGCHPMTNMAAPTPVTDGRAVYALFATGDLAAISKDGALMWYRSLVGDYPQVTNQVGMAASPVLAGDVLCLPLENAGDSFVAGVDTQTGKNLWRLPGQKNITWVTPLVLAASDRPTVLFQTGSGAVAVDARTGKERWKLKSGLSTIPSPTQGEGMIFTTSGDMKAVRPRQDGSEPEEVWTGSKLGGDYASPLYHRGRVYGMSKAGLICMNAADGKELWRQRIEGPFDASPVIGDGKLYAVNRKGRTFVVELGDKPQVLARNDLDDTFLATPAIANGRIYLRSDKFLYCVGPKKEK